MNIFDNLGAIYFDLDSNFASLEARARSRNHVRQEQIYQDKRGFNDQAYYLYLFTRLEDRIKVLSDNLIDNKYLTIHNWSIRRTWEMLYNRKRAHPKNYIHFMDRVALLTEYGGVDYNLIKRYYDQRNSIAHGGGFTIPINIATAIADFKRLYKDLNK